MYGGQGDVNSEIKLESVDQIGVANIVRDDYLRILLGQDFIDLVGDEDSSALRRGLRLNDIPLSFIFLPVLEN
jgi:hypothetical protein